MLFAGGGGCAGDARGGRGRGRGGAGRAAGRRRARHVLARRARVRGASAPRARRQAVQLRAPAAHSARLSHRHRLHAALGPASTPGYRLRCVHINACVAFTDTDVHASPWCLGPMYRCTAA